MNADISTGKLRSKRSSDAQAHQDRSTQTNIGPLNVNRPAVLRAYEALENAEEALVNGDLKGAAFEINLAQIDLAIALGCLHQSQKTP